MNLGEALSILGLSAEGYDGSLPISGVECRPLADKRGKAFFLFPEYHTYQRWWSLEEIGETVRKDPPAAVYLGTEMMDALHPSVRVGQPAEACAALAKAFYDRPDEAIPVIGVTGTNGKTTTTHLLSHALGKLEGSAGSMGTLGAHLNGALWQKPEYTTDLSVEVFRKLEGLRVAGARAVAMEVSSHALALGRVAAVRWKAAVLTNVTRDHLDFHGTLEAYQAAKGVLFESLGTNAVAVLPTASFATPAYAARTAGMVVTYGGEPWADLRLIDRAVRPSGTRFMIEWKGKRQEVATPLVGAFQLANLMAAGATLLGLGYPLADSWEALADVAAVPGRMQIVALPNGAQAVIDYAHNPDGLEVVLKACRQLQPRRLLLVFGCGGDRDRGKRAQMGGIAGRLSDETWLTSDNPRSEDPQAIVDDVSKGMDERRGCRILLDRREAIVAALDSAREGDLVLIAGKGHEDYQLVGEKRLPFSDMGVVEEWIRLKDEAH